MTNRAEHVIVVETLMKRYGNLLAGNSASFTVRKGEVFAFLGPNGAGKTTTVQIIETIRTPTSGKVSVLGMDVAEEAPVHLWVRSLPRAKMWLSIALLNRQDRLGDGLRARRCLREVPGVWLFCGPRWHRFRNER